MSDFSKIHFNSLMTKRIEAQQDQQIKDFKVHVNSLITLLSASKLLMSTSEKMNQVLRVLHDSAMFNKDFEAIAMTEVLCKQILESMKNEKN